MTQLNLFCPPKVNLDGRTDKDGRILYLGDATYTHGDGFYRCLAQVDSALCVVEVRIR